VPETAYAQCGDLSLAYQVVGRGETDVVFAGSFVSHVELIWTLPEAKAWFDQLASFCRILLFDKAGVGLSDPVPKVRSIDDRAAEIQAVMDAAGFRRAVVMGVSEGGPAAIVFAAARPDRVKALILVGTFAYASANWDDLERTAEQVAERLRGTLGNDYAPSAEQVAKVQSMGRAVRSSWGTGEALRVLLPSVRSIRQLGMLERMSASPGMARATIEATFGIDVRAVLPAISVPTLVIHATDDVIPVQGGRYLADHIPGARLVEVEGHDHAPWFSDPDRISDAIEGFLTGAHAPLPHSHRVLRTVLFSDIVSSTARAAAMGDERWSALLERFGEITTTLADRLAAGW
jgi:pimeloyl-ACP methyl ester carboxylesterase